jgi:tungstate transport system permease protein
VDVLFEGLREAVSRLAHGDPEAVEVLLLSLRVSLTATAIAFCLGVPLGAFLALGRYPGRRFALALLNTGMGIPPLVVGISAAALQHVDPDFRVQMHGLGAGRLRSLWAVAVEARLPLFAAVMAGFGAAISEVGAALMVGGNIKGETRVLTTAAVLETSKGNFGLALAYGIVLLFVAFAVNLVLTLAQQRDRPEPR